MKEFLLLERETLQTFTKEINSKIIRLYISGNNRSNHSLFSLLVIFLTDARLINL